jgi:hypothetical protein
MDTSTEQVVEYVRGYGVLINVLFFEFLADDGRGYLARSWLGDPELEPASGGTGKKQPPWNGVDFFVAVGESKHRNWDDMRRYGFVSAGHGDKFRKVKVRNGYIFLTGSRLVKGSPRGSLFVPFAGSSVPKRGAEGWPRVPAR